MLKNYLTIAWRSLLKNRLTALINICGLALGLGGSLIIGLFILDELAYDQHFANSNRIYRLTTTYVKEGTTYHSAQTKGHIGSNLTQQFPEVQHATRLSPEDEAFLFSGETAFKEKIIYTDASFLSVFELDLLQGNRKNCLANPSSIIISKATALKLFGKNWSQKSILGETLSIDGRIPMTITGVFDDFREHSHFHSDLFASTPLGHSDWLNDQSNVYTYALLEERSTPAALDKKLKSLAVSQGNVDKKEQISLQRLTSIHLQSGLDDENAKLGNVKNIYALGFISILLILITVSNFVNLYTASSLGRLKEVGVRKVIGALRGQLRHQFLSESALITLIALCIAVSVVILVLPTFNELTGKTLAPESLLNSNILLLIAGLTIGISVLSGFYPSIFLSGFRIIDALKGVRSKTGAVGMRKSLVILQFSISSVMITLSFVALKQVDLIHHKTLGFDRKNVIALANPYMLGSTEKILAMKAELLTVKGVQQVSITGYTPSQNRWGNLKITFPERNENSSDAQPATWLMVDENFLETMRMTLLAGRNFLDNHNQDKEAILINETAANKFKLNRQGKNPIGSELSFRNDGESNFRNYSVVGIVKDFNFGSLHESVKPIVMTLGYHRFEMALRLSSQYSAQETINRVSDIWKKNLPAIPFEYTFIEDRFEGLHQSDIVASKIFSLFCFATLIVSAFGLFSVVTYTITNRTKEIGIRKSLGASEKSIVLLLSGEFLKVVMISYVLALPLAWLLTDNWISDFAYRINVSWWMYALTGLILFTITASTLGYQTIKAASANPIKQLRYE